MQNTCDVIDLNLDPIQSGYNHYNFTEPAFDIDLSLFQPHTYNQNDENFFFSLFKSEAMGDAKATSKRRMSSANSEMSICSFSSNSLDSQTPKSEANQHNDDDLTLSFTELTDYDADLTDTTLNLNDIQNELPSAIFAEPTAVKKEDPHVKRPMNPFMVWSQIERRRIKELAPDLHNAEISKHLGVQWKQMSHGERQPYVQEANRLRQIHIKQHPDYKFRPRKKQKKIYQLQQDEHDLLQNYQPLTPPEHPHTIQPVTIQKFQIVDNSLRNLILSENMLAQPKLIKIINKPLGTNALSMLVKRQKISNSRQLATRVTSLNLVPIQGDKSMLKIRSEVLKRKKNNLIYVPVVLRFEPGSKHFSIRTHHSQDRAHLNSIIRSLNKPNEYASTEADYDQLDPSVDWKLTDSFEQVSLSSSLDQLFDLAASNATIDTNLLDFLLEY